MSAGSNEAMVQVHEHVHEQEGEQARWTRSDQK